jgi:hypothetical protein
MVQHASVQYLPEFRWGDAGWCQTVTCYSLKTLEMITANFYLLGGASEKLLGTKMFSFLVIFHFVAFF